MAKEANDLIAEIEKEVPEVILPEEPVHEPAVETAVEEVTTVVDEDEDIANEPENVKDAMCRWKADNPNDSLKHQRKLLEAGFITKLPWEDYLKAEADYSDSDNEAAVEAARWAQEQIDASKKKDPVTWMERVEGQQIKRVKED
jgi:hypothetical protein